MKSKLNISVACLSKDRPPISYKVREYFVQFLSDKLLKEKKIIIGGKWNINLSLHFLGEGQRYASQDIILTKGARTVSSENLKIYFIVIPLKLIQESNNPYLKTIEMMYDAIKIFFITTYKKITSEFMDELWKQVDLNYLLSLPYPAPLSDQKYVGDRINTDGTVTIQEF